MGLIRTSLFFSLIEFSSTEVINSVIYVLTWVFRLQID